MVINAAPSPQIAAVSRAGPPGKALRIATIDANVPALVCNCFALIAIAAITQTRRPDLSKALISIASADDP